MKKFAEVSRIENGYLVTYAQATSRKVERPPYVLMRNLAERDSMMPPPDVEETEQWVVRMVADYCKTPQEILDSVMKAGIEAAEIERLVKEGKLQNGSLAQFRPGIRGQFADYEERF